MKKILSVVFSLMFVIVLTGCGSSASENALISMGNHEVSNDDVFDQARIDSQGQGYFNLIDSKLLDETYSYENNETVKAQVDEQIESNLAANPGLLAQFGASDNLDLARRTGILLQAQRQAYVQDYFKQHMLTDAQLQEMYNDRVGELISFNQIQLDETLFDNNEERLQNAVNSVKEQLATANEENIASVFEGLANEYPGDGNTINNGFVESVDVADVEPAVLAALEGMEVGSFTSEPIVVDGVYYFIYKSVADERVSFEARKEALQEKAFENATSENPFLSDFILYNMRRNADVSFADNASQKVFEQAMASIRSNYENRVASLAGSED